MRVHRPWIIWYAIVLHGSWGAMILASHGSVHFTAVADLAQRIPNHHWLGSILLLAGVLALIGTESNNRVWGISLVLSQQFLLMLSAFGAMTAIIKGQFPDGTVRSSIFIACDQLPAILAAVFHTGALLEIFGRKAL